MKTRTLLLLSVATALVILLAGGALLFQLSSQESSEPPIEIGEPVRVGDAEVTVRGSDLVGDVLRVDIEIGGVDDDDGIENFALVTGDRRLEPLRTDAAGQCGAVTTEAQECTVDFDLGATEGSTRVLVLRRGDEQATWRLA